MVSQHKGQKQEHCSLGHFLELLISLSFAKDVNFCKHFEDFTVLGGYSAGLVARSNLPCAKDSIDLIAAVCKNEEKYVSLWGVEVKSPVAMSSVGKESEFIYETGCKRYLCVHKIIQSLDKRCQIMHCAFVYAFDAMIFIVRDN